MFNFDPLKRKKICAQFCISAPVQMLVEPWVSTPTLLTQAAFCQTGYFTVLYSSLLNTDILRCKM